MALDSSVHERVESSTGSLLTVGDSDRSHDAFRLRTHQIDRQQSVLQIRTQYLHAIRQHERALELARGDAAMEILPGLVVVLASTDNELAFLDRHIKLVARESRNSQRNAQSFWIAVLAGNPLDVIRRISVRGLGHSIERTLDLVEAQQKRT